MKKLLTTLAALALSACAMLAPHPTTAHKRPILADVKISQLPSATGVTGADVVPLVHSGVTQSASAAQLLAYIQSLVAAGSTGGVQYNCGSGVLCAYTLPQLLAAITNATAQVITYTAGSGPIYDMSPSGWAGTVAVVWITPASGGSTICGIVQNSSTTPMQSVIFMNAAALGGDNVYFDNECSGESTTSNRLLAAGTLSASPRSGFFAYYDSTVNRWVFP